MTPEEFRALYPQVIGWIRQTLAAHAKDAKSVVSAGFVRLPHYFSEKLLADAKCVLVDRVPTPPLSALGLNRFAAFEQHDYDGITYLDTFYKETAIGIGVSSAAKPRSAKRLSKRFVCCCFERRLK